MRFLTEVSMFKRLSRVPLLLLALSVTSSPSLAAGSSAPAQQLVEDTTLGVLDEIRSNRRRYSEGSRELHGLIKEAVFPHFDFELMGRRVLSRSWRAASSGQRDAFLVQLRLMMLHTYAAALVTYADGDVHFLGRKPGRSADEVVVRTVVTRPGTPELPINYSMCLHDDRWKVYDVTVDGVSLVVNYRASFASKVKKNGLDALIDELTERNETRGE
jgi:phospholipid transport system substrate-binding protein